MDLKAEQLSMSEIARKEGWFFIHPDLADLYAGSEAVDYRGRRINFKARESEKDRIEARMSDESFLNERQQMKKNFEEVVSKFESGEFVHLEIVEQFRAVFLAVKNEEVIRRQFNAQKTQEVIDRLFTHLDQTAVAFSSLLQGIEKIYQRRETAPYIGEQETPVFLTTRQRLLLTKVVAPLHDLAKLLGSMHQIDPDHENAMEYLLKTFGKGQFFLDDEGRKIFLDSNDIAFVALAISSHEDIYREEWFAQRATAMHEQLNQEPNDLVGLERGMSTFHISDILGDAAHIIDHGDGTGTFSINIEGDPSLFDQRFLNLFQRHMQLDGIDGWDEGKAWRPEWGAYAIKSIIDTIRGLEHFGVNMEEGLVDKIQNKMIGKIDEAIHAIEKAGKAEEWKEKVEDLEKARFLMNQTTVEPQSLLKTRGENMMSPETTTEGAEVIGIPEQENQIDQKKQRFNELVSKGVTSVPDSEIPKIGKKIAALLHQMWQQERFDDGATEWFRPTKFKDDDRSTATDKINEWVKEHPEVIETMKEIDGIKHIDILHISYGDLPEPWQKTNIGAGERVVRIVNNAIKSNSASEVDFSELSSQVHEGWILDAFAWKLEEKYIQNQGNKDLFNEAVTNYNNYLQVNDSEKSDLRKKALESIYAYANSIQVDTSTSDHKKISEWKNQFCKFEQMPLSEQEKDMAQVLEALEFIALINEMGDSIL